MNWFLLLAIALLFSMAYAAASGAPWVPTWKRDIERARRLLDLKPGETFVELGCGDGRVTLALTSPQPSSSQGEGGTGNGIRAVGVELSLLQWFVANVRRVLARAWNVRFVWRNAFHYDLRGTDALYLFLMPDAYEKLRPKLEAELRPGARVVTYVWPIPGWKPEQVDEIEGMPKLYAYRVRY